MVCFESELFLREGEGRLGGKTRTTRDDDCDDDDDWWMIMCYRWSQREFRLEERGERLKLALYLDNKNDFASGVVGLLSFHFFTGYCRSLTLY